MPFDKPAKIGRYDIIDIIGRGGMGIVYKATDPNLDRLVAIKMMTRGYASSPDLLKRFFREAQSTGGLQHPNIVTIFELGDHGGNPYLVMEYLEGQSLDSIIQSQRPISLLQKISMIMEVCHGLSYAHNRSIVHRDIKPANIMISNQGAVKIVDFGIAHIGDKNVTSTGQVMGSLGYMSPEQVNGKLIDSRSDIFSTGVVLYQLCTSAMPFEGQSTAATLMKIMHEPPPPLKNFLTVYPPELETVVHRALAKNRDERFQSAEDFALDLGQLHGQLKQDIITRHLREANLLIEKADSYQAREQLLQVLKIDRQNTRATYLLREVQQKIQKEEIGEQVRRLRFQAEDDYAREEFASALDHLDAALRLDKDNRELLDLRDSARMAQLRAQKLPASLRLAGEYWPPEVLLQETLTDVHAPPALSDAGNVARKESDRREVQHHAQQDIQHDVRHDVQHDIQHDAQHSPADAAEATARTPFIPAISPGPLSPVPQAPSSGTSAASLHASSPASEFHPEATPAEVFQSRPNPAISGANALNPIAAPPQSVENVIPSASTRSGVRPISFDNIAGWQGETLRMVERQLAVFIGPLARIVIKKAAAKTTDLEKLYEFLVASIERAADRDTFLAGKVQVSAAAGNRPGPQPLQSPSPAATPDARSELTPAAIELAARRLARHVGPISALLAKRAAQRAGSLRELYSLLAEHVQNKAEREHFLREAGFTGS